MRRKILPRILLVLFTATLISTMMVSSLYAKYYKDFNSKTSSARPAAFDIEFSGLDVDKISVNFASDGEPAPVLGHFKKTVEVPFSVKNSADSEVAADVTIQVMFDSDFGNLLKDLILGSNGDQYSCTFNIYKLNNTGEYVALNRAEKNSNDMKLSWTSAQADRVNVGSEISYKMVIDVFSNTHYGGIPNSFVKIISDAMRVNITAKSVNP